MNKQLRHLVLLVLLVVLLAPALGHAQWQPGGNLITQAPGPQWYPRLVSDGTGGAIVVWRDDASSVGDLYAQRIDGSGAVLWASDMPVCTAPGTTNEHVAISDDAGGAIVAWQDTRNGSSDIFAQRINAQGVAQWANDGVPLCTQAGPQNFPSIVPDGAGGAIVAWSDNRGPSTFVYAQRILASGTVQWAPDGIAVSPAAGRDPRMASDRAAGAIIVWEVVGSLELRVQRINGAGTVVWPAEFVLTQFGNSFGAQITTDDDGGAILAWEDARNFATSDMDVYVQRLTALGSPVWIAGGLAMSTSLYQQWHPVITPDGLGGAVVAWQDNRPGLIIDVYAQRVDENGTMQWTPNGVPVCTAYAPQDQPSVAATGDGGAIITWRETRLDPEWSNFDIFGQKLDASGAPQWTVNGDPVCTEPNKQEVHSLMADGSGGAFVAWSDQRGGTLDLVDIYATRIGLAPTGVGATSAPGIMSVYGNHPNPFSNRTTVQIDLSAGAEVQIDLFDAAGRRVRRVAPRPLPAGLSQVDLDARDDDGRLLPSGVYFYRVRASGSAVTRKLLIVR